MNKRLIGLLSIIFIPLLAVLIFKDAVPQDQNYHQFSDQLTHFGIPNFHNVLSNIFFTIFAGFGLLEYLKNKERYSLSWFVFLLGVFLVAPGSTYYHLSPADFPLIWDRLPMTIGFMGLVSVILCETFNIQKEKPFLVLLLLLGLYSVLHWVLWDDLRIYGWLQLTSIAVILYAAIFYKSRTIINRYLFAAVIFYVIAKITEHNDEAVHQLLKYSGHSIKHIVSSFAILSLVLMKRRSVRD